MTPDRYLTAEDLGWEPTLSHEDQDALAAYVREHHHLTAEQREALTATLAQIHLERVLHDPET